MDASATFARKDHRDRYGWWTEERVDKLKELWGLHQNAQLIAEHLGDGCTRLAVIGKANRIGLPRHFDAPETGKKLGRPKGVPNALTRLLFAKSEKPYQGFRPKKQKTASVINGKRKIEKPEALNVTFADLRISQCKFPVSDSSPHLFCGHPREGDGPYCEYHHSICYAKPRERTEKRQLLSRFNRMNAWSRAA